MKIDFLIAENPYGTTVHFARGLAEALKRQGAETRLFWIGEGHFYHAFYTMMGDPPDLTCSFSDISLQKKPLGELWHIPHLSILIDPAIYFLHQLKGDYSYISCVDENDCDFIRALNFSRVFFFPHGVEANLKTDPHKNRPFDAVFFGTCLDYEAIAERWGENRELLTAASERVLNSSEVSILQALVELGVEEERLPLFHYEVDTYTRGKERVELIKECPASIWGNGPWKKYLPECELHPPVSFEETLNIMKQSKVVLNSSPRFKRGFHERILYAYLCGAAVYTRNTPFLEKNFPEIGRKWQECAEIGQQCVLAEHTWDSRALTLLQHFC